MRQYALIDFDSTLGRFDQAMIDNCNQQFGTAYQCSDIDCWDWWRTLPEEQGAFVWGTEGFDNEAFTFNIPPVNGAIEGVRYLRDYHNYVPIVVSDRPEHHGPWISQWLKRWGLGGMPVEVTNRQTCPKTEVAREYGMTIAVEDAPHNAWALANLPQMRRVSMLHYRYNSHVPNHPAIKRVLGWGHIMMDPDARYTQSPQTDERDTLLARIQLTGDKDACMLVEEMDGHPGYFAYQGIPVPIVATAMRVFAPLNNFWITAQPRYTVRCGQTNCVHPEHIDTEWRYDVA